MNAFATLAAALDYPMFIVTTSDDREPSGCLVGFTTQCSIDPPRFLVCLSKANRTERVADRAEVLVVHLVEGIDFELAELFGGETGDEVDKFAAVRWQPGPGGAPVLDDCPRWFAGRILERFDLGDHVGYLLDPIDGAAEATGPFITFQSARAIDPGHPA